MRAEINYSNIIVSERTLDIDDVCNVALIGKQLSQEEHYLIIQTSAGISTIFSYGPINYDGTLCQNTYCSISKIECNDKKLVNYIDRWLTDSKKHIAEAEIVSNKNELLDKCTSLIEYMRD